MASSLERQTPEMDTSDTTESMHLDAVYEASNVELIVAPTLGRAYRPLRGGAGGGDGGDGGDDGGCEEANT